MKVGLVGCGDIARKAYLPFWKTHSPPYDIVACTDVRAEQAERLAGDFGIPRHYPTVEELLADPEVEMVLNLTHPAGHAPVNLQALQAGKHAYCEKPFAMSREEGRAVLQAAHDRRLQVGCAPDTVLGCGVQQMRRLIEQGVLGDPWLARVQWACGGHERWHPNPAFYYQPGGGPVLDMAPYYLTALVQCLGPIRAVDTRSSQLATERVIQSKPLAGTKIPVEIPTHYEGLLEMSSGVRVQVLFSFDMTHGLHGGSFVEIHGDKGRMMGTDPNRFDGSPEINTGGPADPLVESPPPEDYPAGRGLGLWDMVQAIQQGRTPRCAGEIAFHVLDAMLAFDDSARAGGRVELESSCQVPPLVPEEGLRAEATLA